VQRLTAAAGDQLLSVVLYGAAAREDADTDRADLLIVLRELSLSAIDAVGEPVRWWLARGQPMPRLFSPSFAREAADVFPIEFLDISAHRVVLHGDDLLADMPIDRAHVRLQCERELREKLMRLEEGYIEAAGNARKLERLLTESYRAFVAVFGGCLYLASDAVPGDDAAVVAAFCELAGLDVEPFTQIHALAHGRALPDPAARVFSRYHEQLMKAVDGVDRFENREKGDTQ
jgi:hypothetical protein